jgi:hypothetical protein
MIWSLNASRESLARRKSGKFLAISLAVYSTLIVPVVGNLATAAASPSTAPLVGLASSPSKGKAGTTASMSVIAADVGPDGTSLVTLRMPSNTQPTALHVRLNGADVTAKFSASTCSGGACMVGQVGAADGLRQGKNVFQAEAKVDGGVVLTGRTRFDGRSADMQKNVKVQSVQLKAATGVASPAAAVAAVEGSPVAEPFLAPTVGLKTLNDGGYKYGQSPWLEIGGKTYPTTTPSCTGAALYTAIVLDRQTLEEKTGGVEGSPKCLDTNQNLALYLASLPKGEIVIVGSNYGQTPDNSVQPIDTTAIGGTNYTSGWAPTSYMVIGASGAAPGTAFEPHDTAGLTSGWASARGILQEDANGDYNFFSGDGDFVRYAVVPNAPAGAFNQNSTPVTSIQLSMTAAQRDSNPGFSYMAYQPDSGSKDGFWVLRLNRRTLEPLDTCALEYPTLSDGNIYHVACGKFYGTNTTTYGPAAGSAAMKQLAAELTAANNDPWQLIFLTTVGQATCCDAPSAIRAADNGYAQLQPALWALGGTPAYTTYYGTQNNTNTPTPAYTLVTAGGLGNPLYGPTVESSTALLPTHGQTGTVTGTLERNNYAGLFTPGQINQEFTSVLISKGGLNNQFILNTVALQAPVEWPAESQTVKLSGADSIQGQNDAYRFISHSLLLDKYAMGITGSHQDDLHYFFTSSLNTSINYHYFDPKDLPWPGTNTAGFTQCTSVTPGTGGNDTCNYNWATNDTLHFTVNDFNAVRAQTALEVQYLTNVLQYFVTGSTNMRDAIIGGNANVGLALTGAAATVLGNQLMPVAPTQTTSVSWQSILGMMNGLLTITAGIPGVGELYMAEETIQKSAQLLKTVKQAGAWSNEIAGAAGLASGAGSIVSSSTQQNSLPGKYSKFALTIGQLASGALEDQLAHGFDAMVDSITSDWGRISTIGPRIVNVDDPAFFIPNQVVQETVLDGITSGAERQFYGQLMPSFFEVHYWPGVGGFVGGNPATVQPDMGYYTDHVNGAACWAFYLNPHSKPYGTIPPYVGTYTMWAAGQSQDFGMIVPKSDYYLIAKPSDSKGSDTETINTIDPTFGAALFSPQGLNIPLLQFAHPKGPMQTVWRNAGTTNDVTTHSKGSICAAGDYDSVSATPGQPTVTDPAIVHTVTQLTAPSSAELGDAVDMVATVKAGETPVGQGMMYFRVDGQVAASVPMQSDGTASYEATDLALGSHTIKASYGTADGSVYDASSSDTQTLTIYGDGPDLKVSTSASSVSVKRGATSSAVTVSVGSVHGASGDVSFACSGLPMGATCNFSPAQVALTGDGSATTTMTVSVPATGAAAAAFGSLGLLFLPLFGMHGRRRRKAIAASMLVGAMALGLSGCGGDDDKKVYEVPTGTVQVLVSATANGVTRTVPISVSITP